MENQRKDIYIELLQNTLLITNKRDALTEIDCLLTVAGEDEKIVFKDYLHLIDISLAIKEAINNK